MHFFSDFHIHSHFSLATSKKLIPEYLDYWAKVKGIKVVGTGDISHPGWLTELQTKLVPAEEGLYKLKNSKSLDLPYSFAPDHNTRFILSGEISNIYKKNNKTRKVHNLVFFPYFKNVKNFQIKLESLGKNIRSDGRPILGMDCKDLLEICLDISQDCFFVPAHIWTPWFSVLGSKSGFDSIKECYDDLTSHIYALETGLSSDPPMNWGCSFLDQYTLISNSDAHSPEKLGREANIFDSELNYFDIIEAIKDPSKGQFNGTLEFFPQEGKYHYDGHRKCNICFSPAETVKHNSICPRCKKKLTIGVSNRVSQLRDRLNPSPNDNPPYHSIIGLKEILSEIYRVGPNTQTVFKHYNIILNKLETPELEILFRTPLSHIKEEFPILAEALRRMRNKKVIIKEGFDGQYGQIRLFQDNEI